MGIDASEAALKVAEQNVCALGLAKRCKIRSGNWFTGLSAQFDVIVSNPPYIETGALEELQTEVREYEPVSALDGGDDGLDCYRVILGSAMDYLTDGGLLAFEVGIGQAPVVALEMKKGVFTGSAYPRIWPGLSALFPDLRKINRIGLKKELEKALTKGRVYSGPAAKGRRP